MGVAITGIGVLSAVGNGREAFWESIRLGRSGLKEMTRFDASKLSTRFVGEVRNFDPSEYMSEQELHETERCSQLAFAAAWEAFENASLPVDQYSDDRKGVVIGTSLGGIPNGEVFHSQWLHDGYIQTDESLLLAYPLHTSADFLSIRFRLKGPKITISTACSASSGAIGYGATLINAGKADLVIVGGTDPLSMLSLSGFNSLKALSSDPCSPYCQSKGITIAEGAGMLILERLDLAERRGATILGLVGGCGLSSDAYHPTAPNPGGAGAFKSMHTAVAQASLNLDEIDYVNGHGTGTRANDSAETSALKNMFRDSKKPIPVSSTKSMIGHTLGAAGAIEAITCVMSMMHNTLPPTVNFDESHNPYGLDFVPNTSRKQQVNTVLSNSFAFGGNNVSLLFQNYDHSPRSTEPQNVAHHRTVITGLGIVQPLGIGKESFFSAIVNGKSAIQDIPFQNEVYHSRVGALLDNEQYLKYINPSVVRRLDMLSKYSMASAKMTLDDAKLKVNRDNCERIAIIFGTSSGPIETVEAVNRSIVLQGADKVNPSLFPNTVMNAAAGHICLAFQIKGPSTTICSGGVSGSQAIIYAHQMIKDGIVDAALVIASDEYNETLHAGYDRLGVLSDTIPVPFDREGRGFALSGGSTAILLESEEHAIRRGAEVYGEVFGYGIASDAYRIAGNQSSGKDYARSIELALQDSGKTKEQIDAIFTDARGSKHIDMVEANAVRRIFKDQVPVTSLAGLNGYAVGGLTPVHTAAAVFALKEHVIPAIANDNPIASIRLAGHAERLQRAETFMINSSAYGGTYTSLVIGKYRS
ncbi:3-oxoacyl-[acyl-carrier-protein] synthase II [Paenibacillus shirakamiensis]|uniref:3-oxoacyl-[acyl-carrier-protein] synthase II n=1 Tax=Paenibacillus shirakamiensis TaxID=1265935 RepID=A0ABS4JFG3_9BACL|nr:beta-ketoacyl-[acyl-carrier-protein] synthase family protein [Paenibacillus shirakamiensis]MBP2000451.1 3-oxoacyl-[acyl-carrier-protein] synthase II [Paenibacillus shirakamiensis]